MSTPHRVLHDNLKAHFDLVEPVSTGVLVIDKEPACLVIDDIPGYTMVLEEPKRAGQFLTVFKTEDVTVVAHRLDQVAGSSFNIAGDTHIDMELAGTGVALEAINVNGTLMWRLVSSNNPGDVVLS